MGVIADNLINIGLHLAVKQARGPRGERKRSSGPKKHQQNVRATSNYPPPDRRSPESSILRRKVAKAFGLDLQEYSGSYYDQVTAVLVAAKGGYTRVIERLFHPGPDSNLPTGEAEYPDVGDPEKVRF
jgi:hypothetical protein